MKRAIHRSHDKKSLRDLASTLSPHDSQPSPVRDDLHLVIPSGESLGCAPVSAFRLKRRLEFPRALIRRDVVGDEENFADVSDFG